MILAAKKIRNPDKDTFGFFSEKEMLKEFINVIERFDPDIILGYNINNFDLPSSPGRGNTFPNKQLSLGKT